MKVCRHGQVKSISNIIQPVNCQSQKFLAVARWSNHLHPLSLPATKASAPSVSGSSSAPWRNLISPLLPLPPPPAPTPLHPPPAPDPPATDAPSTLSAPPHSRPPSAPRASASPHDRSPLSHLPPPRDPASASPPSPSARA